MDRARPLAVVLCLGWLAAPAALADPVEADGSVHVGAPPDRVFAVLTDFDAWGRVFESVEMLGTERVDAHHVRIRQRVERAGLTLTYTLAASVDPAARRVDVALDPSDRGQMEELASTWTVAPDPSGGSIVTLHVVSRTNLPVPRFVERRVAKRTTRDSLDDLVRALERRAASRDRVGAI